MKSVYISLCWFCVLVLSVAADAATYAFKSTVYNWETTNQNVIWDQSRTTYPRDDDKQVVNLGFNFNFAGQNYNQVRIHANGVLQFGADTEFHRQYENTNLPVTNLPPNFCQFFFICYPGSQADRLMAIYWDDINPTLGGTVRYQTKGAAPNRRFIVSWENVPHYNFGGEYSFQAILYENGEFVYQYGGGNTSGVSSTIGVEVDNNDYTLYSFNSAFSYAGTAILWYRPSGQPQRLAEYWFEEGQWSYQPNEVIDWTGNGYNGNAIGEAQSTANGWVCRAADIPQNFNATVSGINTNIDVDATIGRSGSISFWYNSNQRWNQGDKQLFDASGLNNRWFYLTKKTNGRLRFAVSDSAGATVVAETPNDNSAAGNWRHIAVTWRLAAGSNQTVLRIYVDGNLLSSQQGTTNGALPSSLGTLILGDNVADIQHTNGGSLNSADGRLDEVKVYNFELSNADVLSDMSASHDCVLINHLRIEHDGQGLTCAPESITVKACSNNNCTSLYPGTVAANITANGSTIGNVTFSGGSGSFTFEQPQAATLMLGGALSPPALFPTQCRIDASNASNASNASCQIVFEDTGWLFEPVAHQVSGVNFDNNIQLQAVRKNDNSGACESVLSGPQNVELKLSCVDPGNCSSESPMRFQFSDASNISRELSKNTFSSYNLNFIDGQAQLGLPSYTDVGQIRIDAQKLMDTGALLTGSSNAFVVRPHSLVVAAVERLNGSANPGTTIDGAGFVAAGEPFTVKLESRNAQGQRTLNFGREITPERLTVSLSELSSPLGGRDDEVLLSVNGSFNNVPAEPGQVVNNDVSWHEVGSIKLSARFTDNDYLGAGDASVKPASNIVGRFYPASISVERREAIIQMYTPACGNFSYLGQPFAVDVRLSALNVAGNVTQNYFGDLASADFKIVTENGSGAIDNRILFENASGAPNVYPLDWQAGMSSVATKAMFVRQADGAPGEELYMLNSAGDNRVRIGAEIVNEKDAVAISMPNLMFNVSARQLENSVVDPLSHNADLRFGRLVLNNAHGPENEPLPVTVKAEYWNGQRFITNTEDNCTMLASERLMLSGPVPLSQITVSGALTNGVATLLLTPAALNETVGTNIGFYRLVSEPATTDDSPWLQYDWIKEPDGDPVLMENPTAEFMFGRFRGNPRQIFWRERFQ